jgi:hypothetical protein
VAVRSGGPAGGDSAVVLQVRQLAHPEKSYEDSARLRHACGETNRAARNRAAARKNAPRLQRDLARRDSRGAARRDNGAAARRRRCGGGLAAQHGAYARDFCAKWRGARAGAARRVSCGLRFSTFTARFEHLLSACKRGARARPAAFRARAPPHAGRPDRG